MGCGEIPQRYRQRSRVIVMTMREGHGFDVNMLDKIKLGEGATTFSLGMNPGVQQQMMAVQLKQPAAGANIVSRIQICYLHHSIIPDIEELNLKKVRCSVVPTGQRNHPLNSLVDPHWFFPRTYAPATALAHG
jgi:hypothetical protein